MLTATRVLAAGALFLFVGVSQGDATWLMGMPPVVLASVFSVLFVLFLTVLQPRTSRFVRTALLAGVLTVMSGAIAIGAVTLFDLDISRLTLAFESALLYALLLINLMPSRTIVAATNILAFLVILYPNIVDGSLQDLRTFRQARGDDSSRYLLTSRYDVKVVDHVLFDREQEAWGGGLARIDATRILLVTGEGQILVLTPGPSTLGVRDTGLRFPLKRKEYAAGVSTPNRWFRVTGILLDTNASPGRLYVAHHEWNTEGKCLTLNLSDTEFDVDNLPSDLTWVSRFSTSPCISGENLVNETGGRLGFIDDDRILMTVGVHSTDGSLDLEHPSPTRRGEGTYGTTVAIRRSDWSAQPFTTGHRNPQGLLVEDGRIWSTEHGPQGGDELNLLVEGADYGWPQSTYGTQYGGKNWPFSTGDDPHQVGTKPIFAWVPSIGVSNLIRIRGTAFPAWKSDLMVASLVGLDTGYALFRVRLDGNRVVLVEKMFTRRPIRDLIEHSDGRLLLWDGMRAVQTVEPETHVFSACSGCHALRPNVQGIGPDLTGIVGADIARYRIFPYSNALRSMPGRWTRGRLDQFLKDPSAFAPGTTMAFPGIEDEQQRALLIRFLDQIGSEQ